MVQIKKNSDPGTSQPTPVAVKRARGGFHFQRLPDGTVNIAAKDIVSEHQIIAQTTLSQAEWDAVVAEMAGGIDA